MSLFVAVGTCLGGFDELVEAADDAARHLALTGFAQIGHSRHVPRTLRWQRFLPAAEMQARIGEARVVLCHAGVGLLGEAMRAGRPIVAMARRHSAGLQGPGADQSAFLAHLARLQPLRVADDPEQLEQAVAELLAGPPRIDYRLDSDIPQLIADYLRAGCCMGGRDEGS